MEWAWGTAIFLLFVIVALCLVIVYAAEDDFTR